MPDDLEFHIKTTADNSGTKAAREELEKLTKAQLQANTANTSQATKSAMSKDEPGRIAAAVNKLKVAFDEAGGGFSGLQAAATSALSGIATAIGPVGVALAALGATVGIVIVAFRALLNSVKDYADAEDAVANLDKALARNGHLTDEIRAKYMAMAGEMQNATGVADEKWMAVLATLEQFGSSPDTIDKDIKAVKGLASALKVDLETAAELVGKAIKGHTEGLSRYGFQMDENASRSARLAQLYQQIEQRGGAVGASQETLNKTSQKAATQWGEFKEALEGFIVRSRFIQTVLGMFIVTVELVNKVLGQTPDKLKGMKNSTDGAAQAMREAEEASDALIKRLEGMQKASEASAASMQNQLSILEKFKSLEQQVADAKLDAQLKLVDAAEKQKTITSEQATAERYALKEAAAKSKLAHETDQDLQINYSITEQRRKVRHDYLEIEMAKTRQGGLTGEAAKAATERQRTLAQQDDSLRAQQLGTIMSIEARGAVNRYQRVGSASDFLTQQAEILRRVGGDARQEAQSNASIQASGGRGFAHVAGNEAAATIKEMSTQNSFSQRETLEAIKTLDKRSQERYRADLRTALRSLQTP